MSLPRGQKHDARLTRQTRTGRWFSVVDVVAVRWFPTDTDGHWFSVLQPPSPLRIDDGKSEVNNLTATFYEQFKERVK